VDAAGDPDVLLLDELKHTLVEQIAAVAYASPRRLHHATRWAASLLSEPWIVDALQLSFVSQEQPPDAAGCPVEPVRHVDLNVRGGSVAAISARLHPAAIVVDHGELWSVNAGDGLSLPKPEDDPLMIADWFLDMDERSSEAMADNPGGWPSVHCAKFKVLFDRSLAALEEALADALRQGSACRAQAD
jgi:hypothetical protein